MKARRELGRVIALIAWQAAGKRYVRTAPDPSWVVFSDNIFTDKEAITVITI